MSTTKLYNFFLKFKSTTIITNSHIAFKTKLKVFNKQHPVMENYSKNNSKVFFTEMLRKARKFLNKEKIVAMLITFSIER